VVPLIFFSLSGSKLPAYILPVLPPLALLGAREIVRNEVTTAYRVGVLVQAAFWVVVGVALGFFGDTLNIDFEIGPFAALVPALALAGLLVAVAVWFPPPALGTFNAVSMSIVVLAITIAVFPRVQSLESMRPWEGELDQFVEAGDSVVLYKPDRWMEYGLQYYREAAPRVALSAEELAMLTRNGDRLFCIAENHLLDELSADQTVLIEVVSSVGDQSAFWAWQP
jgi:4-amino-4-deoxy-L-arabinose transferase-like glycosyltransferase